VGTGEKALIRRRLGLIGLGALALLSLGPFAAIARADDSQIRISEVYSDANASLHSDYIELQMMADGQTIPAGSAIRLYNANASASVTFNFPPSVTLPASLSQRTLLLGWDDNPNADFSVNAGLNPPPAGGAACYYRSVSPSPEIPVDCVSWGAFTGAVPSVGSPAAALNAGQSLTRTEARGCATLLDAPDDTDNSAADFALATPSPRNNLQTPSEHPCPAAPVKKKCKKKKHHRSAAAAKKKCKKKKR
jgi:hypothetical protein